MHNDIVVIDGNSLINRAYYAMQRPMITKEGIYTQGIFGFLNMLLKIRNEYEPEYIAVAWDRKAPTFRHKSYEDYKAGRKKMPPELAMELPIIKELLSAMDITNLEIDGYEADDIIGTVSRVAEEEGLQCLIITGDKDALQLTSEKTNVLITKKGVSDFELYDLDKMNERYGLTPSQFIDLKGLMGDKSDNIPGIPGVGEVTALKLLNQFGTIANMIPNTDEIKNEKLRTKVEDNIQLVAMSCKLAEIYRFVPIDFDIESLKVENPDNDKIIDILVKLEFNSFLKRMNLLDSNKEAESEEDLNSYNKITVNFIEDLKPLRDAKESEIFIKLFGDNSHVKKPEIFSICILHGNNYFYLPSPAGMIEDLVGIFNEKKPGFIGHELEKDYYMLMAYGLLNPKTVFDTAVAQYGIDSSKSDYSLKVLALEYLHKDLKSEKEALEDGAQMDLLGNNNAALGEYGFEYLVSLKGVVNKQKEILKKDKLDSLCVNMEFPLIEILASMESTGVKVDIEVLKSIGEKIYIEVEKLESSIYELCGEKFNINSPTQLGTILFEKLGLPSGKKTKRGYSTSAEILEKLKDKHPAISLILEYRTLTKLRSTYVEGLIPLVADDGRIHAHFQQTVTATGRLSCTEPNLQNIPIRQDFGRKLRKAFIANDDSLLVGADYSQIELRVLAHMASDENLIEAFNNGEDIHRKTAARVFNLEYDEVTSLERSKAKAVNFGVIYGMSSFGLSEEIHVSRKEAEGYIKDYFAKHPKVESFMEGSKEFCKEHGYTETIFGRRRYIHELASGNFMVKKLGERLAMNSPIQGSAADIIKLAMIAVSKALREQNLHAKLILQIHDELIIECPKNEIEAVQALLKEKMESAAKLDVALLCDMNTASTWYELK